MGVRLHWKACWIYSYSTCRPQLFRSVKLLLIKFVVQHISRMHFLKKDLKIHRQMGTITVESTLAVSAMVDFNQ